MKLTKYGRNKLLNTFALHNVPKEYADPIYNYLVFGFHPGSFWAAVLANDFARAMQSSHPGNTVQALKNTMQWLNNYLPYNCAWGSAKAVTDWLELSTDNRRATLESLRLIHTEKEELILILRDDSSPEPILW